MSDQDKPFKVFQCSNDEELVDILCALYTDQLSCDDESHRLEPIGSSTTVDSRTSEAHDIEDSGSGREWLIERVRRRLNEGQKTEERSRTKRNVKSHHDVCISALPFLIPRAYMSDDDLEGRILTVSETHKIQRYRAHNARSMVATTNNLKRYQRKRRTAPEIRQTASVAGTWNEEFQRVRSGQHLLHIPCSDSISTTTTSTTSTTSSTSMQAPRKLTRFDPSWLACRESIDGITTMVDRQYERRLGSAVSEINFCKSCNDISVMMIPDSARNHLVNESDANKSDFTNIISINESKTTSTHRKRESTSEQFQNLRVDGKHEALAKTEPKDSDHSSRSSVYHIGTSGGKLGKGEISSRSVCPIPRPFEWCESNVDSFQTYETADDQNDVSNICPIQRRHDIMESSAQLFFDSQPVERLDVTVQQQHSPDMYDLKHHPPSNRRESLDFQNRNGMNTTDNDGKIHRLKIYGFDHNTSNGLAMGPKIRRRMGSFTTSAHLDLPVQYESAKVHGRHSRRQVKQSIQPHVSAEPSQRKITFGGEPTYIRHDGQGLDGIVDPDSASRLPLIIHPSALLSDGDESLGLTDDSPRSSGSDFTFENQQSPGVNIDRASPSNKTVKSDQFQRRGRDRTTDGNDMSKNDKWHASGILTGVAINVRPDRSIDYLDDNELQISRTDEVDYTYQFGYTKNLTNDPKRPSYESDYTYQSGYAGNVVNDSTKPSSVTDLAPARRQLTDEQLRRDWSYKIGPAVETVPFSRTSELRRENTNGPKRSLATAATHTSRRSPSRFLGNMFRQFSNRFRRPSEDSYR